MSEVRVLFNEFLFLCNLEKIYLAVQQTGAVSAGSDNAGWIS